MESDSIKRHNRFNLTYLPLEDFETSKANINAALQTIMKNLKKVVPEVKITFYLLLINKHKNHTIIRFMLFYYIKSINLITKSHYNVDYENRTSNKK